VLVIDILHMIFSIPIAIPIPIPIPIPNRRRLLRTSTITKALRRGVAAAFTDL